MYVLEHTHSSFSSASKQVIIMHLRTNKSTQSYWGGEEVTTGMAFSPHWVVIFHMNMACKMWPVS